MPKIEKSTEPVPTLEALVNKAQKQKCDVAYRDLADPPCTLDQWRAEWRRQYVQPLAGQQPS